MTDDSSGFGSPDISVNNIATIMRAAPSSLKQGVNYWRVRAIDQAGNVGPWAVAKDWNVNSATTPAPDFQLITTTGGTPTFTWTAIPGATEIHVQVSTSTGFGSLVRDITTPLPTATSLLMNGANALPFGTYYWRLAVNLGSGLVASPAYRKLTVTPPLPTAPVLGLPNTGSFTNNSTPTLNWNAVAYPYAGVTLTYEYQVSSTPTFVAGTILTQSNTASLDATVSPALTVNALTYWRVRAQNSLGVYGAYSLVKSFTFDNVLPLAPNVVAPGSTIATPVITVSRPAYSWSAVASGGVTTYRLQVDNNNSFASPEVNVAGLTTISNTPTITLLPGLHYMRVQATDAGGNVGPFSVVASFYVNPMLLPADNINLITTTIGTPTFTWTAIPVATEIHVQVSTSTGFGSLVRDITTPLPTATSLLMNGANALPFGTYYWRLAVNLGSGLVASPAYRKLTGTPPLPAAPTLVSPVTNASLFTGTPLLVWNSIAYPYAGTSITYEIVVDNNNTFASPERTLSTNGGSITVTPALPAGLYYWRVRAINNYGVSSGWSLARSVILTP